MNTSAISGDAGNQKYVPDDFFTAAQHERLEDLRQRRDTLTVAERAEWEELVNAELDATIARADALCAVRKEEGR